eukprot:m.159943 g.159943  ORF g.159943 m.159943 type:complete len:268 (+) comp11881_c0_seq1:883-1686(+)
MLASPAWRSHPQSHMAPHRQPLWPSASSPSLYDHDDEMSTDTHRPLAFAMSPTAHAETNRAFTLPIHLKSTLAKALAGLNKVGTVPEEDDEQRGGNGHACDTTHERSTTTTTTADGAQTDRIARSRKRGLHDTLRGQQAHAAVDTNREATSPTAFWETNVAFTGPRKHSSRALAASQTLAPISEEEDDLMSGNTHVGTMTHCSMAHAPSTVWGEIKHIGAGAWRRRSVSLDAVAGDVRPPKRMHRASFALHGSLPTIVEDVAEDPMC